MHSTLQKVSLKNPITIFKISFLVKLVDYYIEKLIPITYNL